MVIFFASPNFILDMNPIANAESGNAIRYPNVGEKTTDIPPRAFAKTGNPKNPITRYIIIENAPHFALRRYPARNTPNTCNVIGTKIGIVICAHTDVIATSNAVRLRDNVCRFLKLCIFYRIKSLASGFEFR